MGYMYPARRHLLFLLEGEVADAVQAMRARWDPVMAARIPPHLSLVYPEEVTDERLLLERTTPLMAATDAFSVSLTKLEAEDENHQGVWFGIRDPSGTWTRLRAELLRPPFRPRPVQPHTTVVHPRTSQQGSHAFSRLSGTQLEGVIDISELLYTETAESGMVILKRFPLLPMQPVQVVAGLLCREGRILLCHRRPERDHYPNVWDLPGGRVEPNETNPEALIRELREELGIVPHLSTISPWKTLSNDEFQLHIYLIEDWQGGPENLAPAEHDELRWLTADDATRLNLADDSYQRILRQLTMP